MTLCNMAIEAGGTCGICYPDEKTVDYLWPFIKDEFSSKEDAVKKYAELISDEDASYEKVIAKNPDVIIIAIMGSESGIAAQEKLKWQRFGVVNAVKNDRVHIVAPDLICSPSPATFSKTLQTITKLIHPENS